VFSIIAILIACIGLFALVAFMVQQRAREIAIRKVLGASLRDVVALLTRDFAKLIVFANLVAWPLGWVLMHSWLNDFAYRIHIDWYIFVLAGLIALMIAMATIGLQALKAATANPIKTIRSS
jgi:putative ABC transport system permease protein